MPGQSYSRFQPGDACWIIVDQVNSPTGYWEGEVLTVSEPHEDWWEVTAKLTDQRLLDDSVIATRGNFYGREPTLHYRVIPANKEFEWLIKGMERLRRQRAAELLRAKHREETLLAAIERVCPKEPVNSGSKS